MILIFVGILAFIGLVLFLFRKNLGAFLRFLVSKLFLINFALALSVGIIIPYCSLQGLDSYTNHGEKIAVPNFFGINVSDTLEAIGDNDLTCIVIDSVFSNEHKPGTIIRQDPEPHYDTLESYVKPGRKIYLTIVKLGGEYRTVPTLTGDFVKPKSIAKQMLEMNGFVPFFTSVPSKNDYVIELKYKGKTIQPGEKLLKGSEIEVVVGSGAGGVPVTLPNVIGKTILEANQIMSQAGLVLDIIIKDAQNANDSLYFMIKSQNPTPGSVQQGVVASGTVVTVVAGPNTEN
jgi:eukaryotic-like serine/threonine-protein kinase